MRFKVTPISEGLRKLVAVSFVLLWLLPSPSYCVNGAGGGRGELGKGVKQNVCTEKSCKGSTCDLGQICGKVSHPEKDYDCYECKNCTNVRTYAEEVKPGEVFQLEEECLHVRVECAACPQCVSEQVNVALTSNSSVGESTESSATFVEYPVVFLLFSAFLLSAIINLFLLSIIIMIWKNSKAIAGDVNVCHETMVLPVLGTQQK